MAEHWWSKIARGALGWMLTARTLVVFALGFAAAWFFFGSADGPASSPTDAAEQTQGGPQIWTCAMHPQIRRDGPGDCPLCGMELVPVTRSASGGMRTITISPTARKLMNVQTSPVERRYVSAEARMVGKIEYDETRISHITAWVSGRLDRMFVDYAGITVNKNDHLVRIYSEELYTAQAELIKALAAERRGSGSSQSTKFRINLAAAAREKLRLLGLTTAQLKDIEQQDKPSEHMTIYSPIGGIVVEKLRQQGDRVRTGDRIYTVADLSQLWVKLDAYESDLVWLRYGQEVSFTTEAYPGETFTGRIAFIDPVLNKDTRTVKVRVNVANPDGKLKPDMFVRAIAKSDIAAGGKVLSADLVGKWVSPMHPEIIRDAPGNCPVCGMPLVRAESLGYVPATKDKQARPLVIPTSAAMVTGTRAIVYVEEPAAEAPTFSGREIVLGPRAGDYYLVRNGLKEGELVVTSGNFKLDSALQIEAKPTMMTPEGGGGGGHDHGGHGSKKPGKANEGTPVVTLTDASRSQLEAVIEAFKPVTKSVEDAVLQDIRQSFTELDMALERVDKAQFEGHAAMQWQEFAMLLSNDIVEGSEVSRLSEADRIYLLTKRHLQRVRDQLGLGHSDHASHMTASHEVPDEFRTSLAGIWQPYVRIQLGLAANNLAEVQKELAGLRPALAAIDASGISEKSSDTWAREAKGLATILARLEQAKDLVAMRAAFALLSDEVAVLARSYGLGHVEAVYELHCPMAFDGRGAIWLQPTDEVRNPYFGASMLTCADRVELIPARGPPKDGPVKPESGEHKGHAHE